jgi:hypothetical protein
VKRCPIARQPRRQPQISGRDQREPQYPTRLANPAIEAQERQAGDARVGHESGREVERVQRSHGLTRKRAPRTLHDFILHPHRVPVAGLFVESGALVRRGGLRDLAQDCGPDERAVDFDQCEIGRDDDRRLLKGVADLIGLRLAQKPGENSARLGVDVQRSPRSSSRRRSAVPSGVRRGKRGTRRYSRGRARDARPLRTISRSPAGISA